MTRDAIGELAEAIISRLSDLVAADLVARGFDIQLVGTGAGGASGVHPHGAEDILSEDLSDDDIEFLASQIINAMAGVEEIPEELPLDRIEI